MIVKIFAEDKGFLSKLFNRGQKLIEKKLFDKYQTMGSEIDKVYIEIMKYEQEMKKNATLTLEQLYEQNFQYYLQLEKKYIVAGELAVKELKEKNFLI
ncbi:hypothetical protein GCM10020331_004300 [Ectobacillus funiculus]